MAADPRPRRLGKIACHYYAGVFPTDEPLTLTGTITIKDFQCVTGLALLPPDSYHLPDSGAHELTDTPIAFVFGATTRAISEAVTETPAVPFTIHGYKPMTVVLETVDLPTYANAVARASPILTHAL